MKQITVSLSREQLEILLTLTDNQLFRMKYIDPKMPGHKARPEDLENARTAVRVLNDALSKVRGFGTGTGTGTTDRRQISIQRNGAGN